MATQARELPQQWRSRRTRTAGHERLANSLGWFSIGLGLAEVAVPRKLAELIGVKERAGVIRGLGLREIASGIGILSQRRPAGFLWSRVAGDALDLSLLGANLNSDNRNRGRAVAATAAVAGVTMLDVLCSRQLTMYPESGYRSIRVSKAVTVNRSPEELYKFWRNFENLPRFMQHLQSVQLTSDRRSHWVTAAPAGASVEWDAEIVDDVPDSRIAWRSVGDPDVHNSGVVRFERAPGGRGSIVCVDLKYDPPGGRLGAIAAKIFGEEPGQQLEDDLRIFKQVMETGEVTKSDASIHKGMHPAQPPAGRERTGTHKEGS